MRIAMGACETEPVNSSILT